MSGKPEIVALGEALVEFVKLPETREGRPIYRQSFGGDTSNAIIAAARQGASTAYITAVGGDPFGRELIDLWQHEGVSTDFVRVHADDPTGVYFVQPHAEKRNFSYARRGSAASLFIPDELPEQAIADAAILHVSALSQAISATMHAAVNRAAQIARSNSTIVSYDTNLRLNMWSLADARKAIGEFLPLADIVFPSDDEAQMLTGLGDADALVDHYLGFGARQVLLKRGSKGVLLAGPGYREVIPTHAVKAVDSTGAGDSFAGAYLAYYLETGDLKLAAERAALVAAGTVSGIGAIAPIPYRRDVVSGE